MDRSIDVDNLHDKSYAQPSFDGTMDMNKNVKKVFNLANLIFCYMLPLIIYILYSKNMVKLQVTKTLVTNGCVDYKGNIADKRTTGGWKASPFIIGLFVLVSFLIFFFF